MLPHRCHNSHSPAAAYFLQWNGTTHVQKLVTNLTTLMQDKILIATDNSRFEWQLALF